MKKRLLSITLGILCSLVFVLTKNVFSSDLLTQDFGLQGAKKIKTIDNLFIGSSVFKQGLDMEVIDENIENSYMIAYNNNCPVFMYYELLDLLDSDVSIKNLYIDLFPSSMNYSPSISDDRILFDLSLKRRNEVLSLMDNDSLSFYYQYYVSSNSEYYATFPLSARIFNLFYCKGGNSVYHSGASSETLLSKYYGYNYSRFDKTQTLYLKKLIQLSKEHGINIHFLYLEKYYLLEENAKYTKAKNRYSSFIKSWGAEYIELSEFDNGNPDYYSDPVHCSTNGSIENSNILVKKLSE